MKNNYIILHEEYENGNCTKVTVWREGFNTADDAVEEIYKYLRDEDNVENFDESSNGEEAFTPYHCTFDVNHVRNLIMVKEIEFGA